MIENIFKASILILIWLANISLLLYIINKIKEERQKRKLTEQIMGNIENSIKSIMEDNDKDKKV